MPLRAFLPVQGHIGLKECIHGAFGAGIGLFCTELLCQWLLGFRLHWLIAPMGASAVLLFAAPASPLAQPWSLIVGNILSALVGISCAKLIGPMSGHLALASGVAVMIAIAAMLLTRSLHPPGGAVALTSVIGGSAVADLGYQFVAVVAINSLLLLILALLYSRALHRRYPNLATTPKPHQTSDPLPSQRLAATEKDIEFALQQHEELLDISPQDLQTVLHEAQIHALQHQAKTIRCQDVMSRDVITVSTDDSASDVWHKLAHHQVKALPVVDIDRRLLGIISLHDLIIDATSGQPRTHFAQIKVDALMTQQVTTASPSQALLELVPLFSDGGLHHLPVVDQQQLVGIITQSDMVAALFTMSLQQVHGE
ncbi:HPP family protein [Chitinibacter sp. S2-10]|uniref:HPP family protein n=1 Tax=Chitinibacter sp. S2-10 TaxID=3373597 RepID=UPI0039775932